MTQPPDLSRGLVRILTDGSDHAAAVGAGFLVSARHIVTCAHVIAETLGIPPETHALPTQPVWLDFPLVAGTKPMAAQVTVWYPVKAKEARYGALEDIVVLTLLDDSALPNAAQPVPVVVIEDHAFFDRSVRMYGFAQDQGDWVSGQLQGLIATGWVQLDHDLGRMCVAPGFSGTAVWDKLENAAVGIIVSTNTRENVRLAYMIPVASLIRAWPMLDEHSRPPNPYRGLEAFREQDARFFMGREHDVRHVLNALQHRPFVTVVGASGSGKSSLLFAGVVPKLRIQQHWLIADFRPRAEPFRELAMALTRLLYPDLDDLDRLKKRRKLVADFSEGNLNLVDVVDLLLQKNPGKRLLLIADQFEEIYTQNLAPERRRQFLDELITAIKTQGNRPSFTLLLALRIDFLGPLLDYEPLSERVKHNHLLLGPMGLGNLQAVIEHPARQLGVTLETGLAERIIQDMGQPAGALPLLEFALTQLWERQKHRQLTHAAYEAIGGVTQSLARHADQTLARFYEDREQLRRVFVQLVRPGEGTEDTRQVATREQVGRENWKLVTELADERLVVTGRDAQGQETVEVVHEALLRHWQPLRQWMEQDRQFRVWQNRLRQALQEWQEQGSHEEGLLHGARLAEAEERLKHRVAELTQSEQEYIKASIVLHEREIAARLHIRRRTMAILVAGLVIALLLSSLATWQWGRAGQQANRAVARQLAAQGMLRVNTKTGLGLVQGVLMIAESLQRDATLAPSVVWPQTLDLLPCRQPLLLTHESKVTSVSFSKDGQRLATASWDGTARVWDPSGRELARFTDAKKLEAVVFSSNGQRLAGSSADQRVLVWDIASGRELARFTHQSALTGLGFSPDSEHFSTIDVGGIARIWDIASGQELIRVRHDRGINSAAFRPDGQRFATASDDYTARVWDAASGRELARFNHENAVAKVTFSPDGQRLATASLDQTARIWDVASGQELARLAHGDVVFSVTFSPNGQRLATISGDHTARIWDTASGRESARLSHQTIVIFVSFSDDSRHLVTLGTDDTVRIWEVASGRELAWLIHDEKVLDISLNPDSQRLVTASADGIARVWNIANDCAQTNLSHEQKVVRLNFSRDGQRLASASFDHTARIWDTTSGRELVRLTHEKEVISTAFSPDGQHLASASFDHTARIWDTTSGRELARLTHGDAVVSVVFSPDGQRLATASLDKTARVWDAASNQELVRVTHEGFVEKVVFSPDGQRLASASFDHTARIWDAASGRELARLTHGGAVVSVIFSPDRQRLATASLDGTARVWDIASGHELGRFTHNGPVFRAVFSPDGTRLATASWDNTARVWDIASGQELARTTHAGELTDVVFSPDGQRLASASLDKTVRLWFWRVQDMVAEVCKRLPRNLTHAEWRQYVGEDVPYHATCPKLPVPEN